MHLIFFQEIFQMVQVFENSFRGLRISLTFVKIHSANLAFHELFPGPWRPQAPRGRQNSPGHIKNHWFGFRFIRERVFIK